MSAEETKELVGRIHELEKDVKIGKSDVEKAVYETRTLYREVRTVERTVHRVERIMEMMGFAIPTLAIPGVGAVTALAMMIFQIATIVAKKVTELEKLKAERERAVELRQFRLDMIQDIKAEIEADKAKTKERFGGTVP